MAAIIAALAGAADGLRLAAAAARGIGDRFGEEHEGLALGGAEGFAGVLDRLAEQVPVWGDVAGQMREVADLLEHQSRLRGELLSALDGLLDTTPVGWAARQWGAMAGQALDLACAHAVLAVCTPTSGAPAPRRLGELSELGEPGAVSVAALHEYLVTVDPALARLAEEYPDLRFIEGSAQAGSGLGFTAVIGDLDNAETVTTFVAGTGSSTPESVPGQIERARSVAQATGGASVLWLGYRAPDTLAAAVAGAPARVGGEALRAFQNELAARNPGQRRVVVGYSYGSTVLGHAAADPGRPLAADEVVLVGSPGVPQSDASQFALSPGGRVHAITSPADPIDLVAGGAGGMHGIDPTARRFGAQVWPTGPAVGHGDYWDDPLVAEALGRIAEGGAR